MFSLTRNLMIRIGMFPRNEGLRLHFIKYQAPRLFSALAASSNQRVNLTVNSHAPFVATLSPASYSYRWAS